MWLRYVTEKSNLIFNSWLKWLFCTANKDIWLDTHTLKFFNTCLSWLSFHFTRSLKIRNKSYMNKDSIFTTYFMLELSYSFKERLTFDITYSTTNFDNSNFSFICWEISKETALNFISDVRDNLNSTSTKVTTSFFLKNRPVYFTSCYVGIFVKTFVNKSFIVTEVKVSFCAIISYENFTMLNRVHCTWVNVNIRVKLLHCYWKTTGF